MTTRTGTAVIVRAVTITANGDERATNYGPFLPHVGSATTSFADALEYELEQSGRSKPRSTDETWVVGARVIDAGDVSGAGLSSGRRIPVIHW